MNRSLMGALTLTLATLLLAACGGDQEATPAPPVTPTTFAGTAEAPPTTEAPPTEPAITTIRVASGEPVDGVAALDVTKGDRIHFIVESDTAAEVHFHGYDVAIEAGPDTPAEFDLEATIEGVFDVELEETGTLIARVSVAP